MSSTNSHTLSLYEDTQQLPSPIVQIANRYRRAAANSQTSNSDGSAVIPESDIASLFRTDSETNDVSA